MTLNILFVTHCIIFFICDIRCMMYYICFLLYCMIIYIYTYYDSFAPPAKASFFSFSPRFWISPGGEFLKKQGIGETSNNREDNK